MRNEVKSCGKRLTTEDAEDSKVRGGEATGWSISFLFPEPF
jgi:hypothetical protein